MDVLESKEKINGMFIINLRGLCSKIACVYLSMTISGTGLFNEVIVIE